MIVVLTEKPSVGRDLSRILGATKRKEGYMEGNGYVITWAFGHLIELVEPDAYDPAYKSWNLQHLPIVPEKFKLKVSSGKGIKAQFAIVKKLLKSADSIICATDAGREGELIFRYIQQMSSCKSIPSKRLWISSLTDSAIREGFNNLQPLSNYDNLAAAATCRSQADWIVGLNATRGYTVKHSHGRGVFSVGRVQTPVLAMIVKRDQEIRNFKPEDYWELWTKYREVKFKHKKDRFTKKNDAESIFDKVKLSQFEITKIHEKKSSQPPPQLFDLTELQRTMNRLHGFSATKTLGLCQGLYEKKIVTYPRTDSRYLSTDLYPTCKNVLVKLTNLFPQEVSALDVSNLSKPKKVFNTAKVSDHHAIIPTGQFSSNLDRDENFVFRAIAMRFIAVFYPNCDKLHTTVNGKAEREEFVAKGTRIVSPGWYSLYQSEKNSDEQILPEFIVGEQGSHQPEIKSCKTKPPAHYTEATLLTAMETAGKTVDDDELKEAMKEKGLGTPATRAAIIETLIKRDYISKDKKRILSTSKGEDLIALLVNQSTLTSPEMTAEWEYRLKQIEKGECSAGDFMQQVRKFTSSIIDKLQSHSEIDANNLGKCPLCSSPVIKGNTGYGCSDWKSGCVFRFHSEQFGTKLEDKDVPILLARRRLTYPRKLIDTNQNEVRGYITIEDNGQLGMMTCDQKMIKDSIGNCPQCSGSIIDKFKCYACADCDFVIWKKIAGKQISVPLAQVLLGKGKSQTLKGFKSKAGKKFSAALKIEAGKVVFDFNT